MREVKPAVLMEAPQPKGGIRSRLLEAAKEQSGLPPSGRLTRSTAKALKEIQDKKDGEREEVPDDEVPIEPEVTAEESSPMRVALEREEDIKSERKKDIIKTLEVASVLSPTLEHSIFSYGPLTLILL